MTQTPGISILFFMPGQVSVFKKSISWTNSTHEAYYKRDISQRLKPLADVRLL